MEKIKEENKFMPEKVKSEKAPSGGDSEAEKISSIEKERMEELERIIDEAYKTGDLIDEESKKKRFERITVFLNYANGEEKNEAAKKIFKFIDSEMRKDAALEDKTRIRIKTIGLQKESNLTEKQVVDLIKVADRANKFETDEIKQGFKEIPAEYKTVVVERFVEQGKIDIVEKIIEEYPDLQLSHIVEEGLIKAGKEELVLKHSNMFQEIEKSINKNEEKTEQKINIDFGKAENLEESVAIEIMQDEEGVKTVAKHLKKFKELGYEVAKKLIDFGRKQEIADGINSFRPEFHKDISIDIIERGGVEYVVENHEKFIALDYQKSIPEYPEKTTLAKLIEILKWTGMGGMETIKSLCNLKDFSFDEHILPIIKAQKERTAGFFRVVKRDWGYKLTKEQVAFFVLVAESGESL